MDQPNSAAGKSKAHDVFPSSDADKKGSEKTGDQKPNAQQKEEELEPFNIENYKPISNEILAKLLTQAEFYFSDSNVLKDKFLMKNIQTNPGGFISVKLLSSFRRMQAISKDWRDLSYALRGSEKLELNELGNKIRRKDPLPQWDEKVFDRTIIATNLQIPEVSVNAVKGIFGKCGAVTLVRVLQPGKTLPDDLKEFAEKHPELSNRICAVIEFSKEEEAGTALKEFRNIDDWTRMQVTSLKGDPILDIRKGKGGKDKTVVTVDSSPASSPSTRRKKTNSRSGGVPIPDRHKLDAYRGSPSRSPATGRRSPKSSSYAGSGDEFETRTTPKPIPGRMQHHHRGTPTGSPDRRGRGADDSPLSCSPSSGLGTSPWIRRRVLMEQTDPSSSPGKNLITITRQPRGPNGSKGFSGLRPAN